MSRKAQGGPVLFPKSVSSLAVNRDGTLLVLAGKQGLYLSSIEKPEKITKTLTVPSLSARSSQCTVEWNPHPSKQSYLVSSNGKIVYLWDVESRTGRNLLSTVEEHARAIQGLSWSSQNPDLFVSCSNDTNIHIFDTRTPGEVQIFKSFCSFTVGATDVKWNRNDENLLASSHAGEVRVWDLRKETSPLTFITAHNAKINAIDWNSIATNNLLTCAQDKQVKLWSIAKPRRPEATLKSQTSISHAQFLPSGDSMLSVCKEENVIRIWNTADLSGSVRTFSGHMDVIVSVSCCFTENAGAQNQIVSLSRDNKLCLWKIPSILSTREYGRTLLPSNAETAKSKRAKGDRRNGSGDLAGELKALDTLHIPGFSIKEKDNKKRMCGIRVEVKGNYLELKITFPLMYPNGAHPNFSITTTSLPTSQRVLYMRNINTAAQNSVQSNSPCIEKIIIHSVDFLSLQKSSSVVTENHNIPCPRLAGASFAADGRLIYFRNFSFSSSKQALPRSYEGLLKYVDTTVETEDIQLDRPGYFNTLTSFYYTEDVGTGDISMKTDTFEREKSISTQSRLSTSPTAQLVDVNSLLIVKKSLAMDYIVKADSIHEICEHNASVALQHDREDLHKSWMLLRSVADPDLYKNPNVKIMVPKARAMSFSQHRTTLQPFNREKSNERQPPPSWTRHPFSIQLIQHLFSHYERIRDIQTLGMIALVFADPLKQVGIISGASVLRKKVAMYRNFYSQILYSWCLPEKAAVLAVSDEKKHSGLEFGVICKICKQQVKQKDNNCCKNCKRRAFVCSLCNLPVLGMSTFCLHCGHGGHTNHMREWFLQEDVCATGCGCRCIQNHGHIVQRNGTGFDL